METRGSCLWNQVYFTLFTSFSVNANTHWIYLHITLYITSIVDQLYFKILSYVRLHFFNETLHTVPLVLDRDQQSGMCFYLRCSYLR